MKGLNKVPASVIKRAKQIQVLLMDVDGTITTGAVTLLSQPDGTALEIKTFNAHDGQGLSLAYTAGLRTGVITGRESAALRRRARELNIEFVYEKQPHKVAAYEEILKKTGVAALAVRFAARGYRHISLPSDARTPTPASPVNVITVRTPCTSATIGDE